MLHNGRRVVINGALVTAQLGVLTGSLWVWFWSDFSFGEPLTRADYHDMCVGFASGAVLLLLGLAPVAALRGPVWVVVLDVVLAAVCVVAALSAWGDAELAPRDRFESLGWGALWSFLQFPTTWPVLILVAGTPVLAHWMRVRGPSSPGQPAEQDRSAAPGHPSSR